MLSAKNYAEHFDIGSLYFTDVVRDKIAEELLYAENPTNLKKVLHQIVGEEGLGELDAVLSSGDRIPASAQEQKYFEDCVKVVKKNNLLKDVENLNLAYKNEIDPKEKIKIASLISIKTQEIKKL